MIKTICKGTVIGVLVTLVWSAVSLAWEEEVYKSALLPEAKEAEVLAHLQDVIPPAGAAYIVPSPSTFIKKLTEDDEALVVFLFRPSVTVIMLVSILLSCLLPAAFLTWMLCLASKHGFNRRRQHVLFATALGTLSSVVGMTSILPFGYPLQWAVIETLSEAVHFSLMGLAISLFMPQHFEPSEGVTLDT